MTFKWSTGLVPSALALLSALSLAACDSQKSVPDKVKPPEAAATGKEAAADEEPVSIFRSDAGLERAEAPLEPLNARISFDDGGFELSKTAQAELAELIETRQFKAGGAITLRGHTDSEGYDEANLRASKRRADAVRDWLIEHNVPESRLTVIGLGEQNPAKPNAKPDGSPDEAARAFNRRVDITIAVPREHTAEPASEQPTLVEKVSDN